jgi:2,3-bisphosphoglycerate-independent phosphoglycerate mutase
MQKQERVLLMILDGWGKGCGGKEDAITQAKTPFTDKLYEDYPHCQLLTHGLHVGLPDKQMGNSEVGHLNIGAGRIIWQMLELINREFSEGMTNNNPELLELFNYCKQHNKPLHLAGLVSNGGVHSSLEHLYSLIKLAHEHKVPNLLIHAFTDGRDTDPYSGKGFIKDLLEYLEFYPDAKLATVIGRYFAMDRDRRWERINKAYELLVYQKGEKTSEVLDLINNRYASGQTDEFLEPIMVTDNVGQIHGSVNDGDAFLFFNFRTDRGRELTRALSQEDFPDFGMKKLNLKFSTLTGYDKTFKNVGVIFKNPNVTNTLGEVLSQAGKTQLRAAETEKYPHVTFFFSGGREEPFEGEQRIMIPSPKVATYDLKPEMSAPELADAVCNAINNKLPDFICLNFANPDMVGHTGVFEAIVKAVETVDQCAEKVFHSALKHGYNILITADHGNAETALNPDSSPNTAHTTNPVPLWVISNQPVYKLNDGILADLSPTVLKMMNLHKPKEMTGNELF